MDNAEYRHLIALVKKRSDEVNDNLEKIADRCLLKNPERPYEMSLLSLNEVFKGAIETTERILQSFDELPSHDRN